MSWRLSFSTLATLLMLAGIPPASPARVKLTTLPAREHVAIQLQNPRATLVEEERVVPLLRGRNQVDFSWANTRIRPQSIVFRVVSAPGKVEVLAVSYPPNEQALVWSVSASRAGPAKVRISYLIDGLTRDFHYRAVADPQERRLMLHEYLRVRNLAREGFGMAALRLGFGPPWEREVNRDETRELGVASYPGVPIRKTYTASLAEHGYLDPAKKLLKVPMHYVLHNVPGDGLGKVALAAGKVRIFQQDGHGTTAFLGEDWGRHTPRGAEMPLYLGLARDVQVRRTIERNLRRRISGNLYNYEVVVKYEIENFKPAPVTLDVEEDVRQLRDDLVRNTGRPVEWLLGSETDLEIGPLADKTTAERVRLQTALPAKTGDRAEKQVRHLHLLIKNEW